MESVVPALVILYVVGMMVAGSVIRYRAGAGIWYRLKVFGPNGFGPVWIATATACAMVWPVTLAVWLARGCPEPRVVFNDRAVERARRQAAAPDPVPPVPVPPVPAPPASTPGALVTSYGYTAPPGARTDGWRCPSRDCGRGDDSPVRWPHRCPGCGTATDPTFAEPWAHDARGPFLRAELARDDTPAREVWVGALAGWEYTDALRSPDPAAAERARQRARAVLPQLSEATAGSVQSEIVRGALAYGRIDDAADDLLFWSARVRTAGADTDAARRADCRCLLDRALDFLEDPAGARHPWAPPIRHAAGLLHTAVRGLLHPDAAARAVRVLGAPVAAAPVADSVVPAPVPAAPFVPAPFVPAPAAPALAAPADGRAEDPDRLLAAVLAGVAAGSGPVLAAVRNWNPDESGSDAGALARVRRGASVLAGRSGPGSAGWAGAGPEQRADWWVERIGLLIAAAVAASATAGPLADRATFRPAVSMAGQAFVLCAVAGEFGITGRDELVRMLAEVLFGRTPPAGTAADAAVADVARGVEATGTARVVALGDAAWRIGRALLGVRSQVLDRPEPARRSRIGRIPGLGAVGGFVDERAALREVSASGIAWIGDRPAIGGYDGATVARPS